MTSVDVCPCGGATYDGCCGPFISGSAQAPTAEALMRSRYSAHIKLAADYLNRTQDGEGLGEFTRRNMEQTAEETRWCGLQIVSTSGGGEAEQEGTVEFVASYEHNGVARDHHEVSRFRQVEERWIYTSGEVLRRPQRRQNVKVGRNQPCPCGSGKKFKKCCGKR